MWVGLSAEVADEADKKATIYGQEKESATAGLARMNMVLHNCPTALIKCTSNSTLLTHSLRRKMVD
jgi:type I restriction-modification system DNA methylase subunit